MEVKIIIVLLMAMKSRHDPEYNVCMGGNSSNLQDIAAF